MQKKLATTCNNNEQYEDATNNAELYTRLQKTTWKTLEGTARRGRNRSLKTWLLMDNNAELNLHEIRDSLRIVGKLFTVIRSLDNDVISDKTP